MESRKFQVTIEVTLGVDYEGLEALGYADQGLISELDLFEGFFLTGAASRLEGEGLVELQSHRVTSIGRLDH